MRISDWSSDVCSSDLVDPDRTWGEASATASALDLVPEPGNPAMLERLGGLAEGLDGMAVHCPPERRAQWAFLLKSLDIPTEIVVPEISALHPLAIRERSGHARSEEHTSELQSLMRNSYAV